MEYLICLDCGWVGCHAELVLKIDDLNDKDFNYCPDCRKNNFEIEEGEELENEQLS